MNTQAKKSMRIALFCSALFIAGFFFNYFLSLSSFKLLNEQLSKVPKNFEQISYERNKAYQKLADLNNIIYDMQKQDKKYLQQITDAAKTIQQQTSLIADANNKSKMFSSLKSQISDLKYQTEELNAQVKKLNAENTAMKNSENQMNNTIASLTDENQKLKENNSLMSSMLANNILIEATKGKHDKLTVVARRTNKLETTFDIPASLSEHLSFTILSPNGKVFQNGEKKIITYSFVESQNSNAYASLNSIYGTVEKTKRIKLTFRPADKLNKGIYTVQVMNNNMEIGKMQVKLR